MLQPDSSGCGFPNDDNSQTFSNSDPTLGNANGNSNSLKDVNPSIDGNLEDRRQKKRQRKQDKTRKMQSKLTYQPMLSHAS